MFKAYRRTRRFLINTARQNVIITGGSSNTKSVQRRQIFLSCSLCEGDENVSDGKKEKRIPKIYTKTGDKGFSSLFTGERRPKSDMVFETLGDVDEVTSNIGAAIMAMKESWQCDNFTVIMEQMEKIQCTLQDLNSCIATPQDSSSNARLDRTKFDSYLTDELEEWIDFYTAELPPLKNFILPSGGKAACQIHVTRSVCRRAERKVAVLVANGAAPDDIAKYINRLSDFLFTMARYVAMMEGHSDIVYKKPIRRKVENTDDGTSV